MLQFEGDPDDLAPCEKFFWQFVEMENVIERLQAWSYKMQFEEIYEDNKKKCDLVFNSQKLIKDSKAFKTTLAGALGLGNFINGKGKKGCQHGFTAETLAKLGDYKTTDNSMSILGYLYLFLRERYPDSLEWVDEFAMLPEAIRIESDLLDQEITTMDKDLVKVKDLLENALALAKKKGKDVSSRERALSSMYDEDETDVEDDDDVKLNPIKEDKDSDDDDRFVDVMTLFYKDAKKQVTGLQGHLEATIEGTQQLA